MNEIIWTILQGVLLAYIIMFAGYSMYIILKTEIDEIKECIFKKKFKVLPKEKDSI